MNVITYGEASPRNTKNAYPYAMAEKRAIDRAILKLIGLHGFIYSEDELDVKQTSNTKVGSSDDEVLEKFQSEIKNSKTSKGLKGYGQMYKVHMAKAKQSSHAIYLHTKTLYENKLKELNGGNHTNV